MSSNTNNRLNLSITTPTGVIFDGDVSHVNLPGKEGEFGVYPNHASLLSLLDAGIIMIDDNGKQESVLIDWGYVEIEEHSVCVLVDNAVSLSGDTESIMAEKLDEAKNLLESAKAKNSNIGVLQAQVDRIASSY